ncbi:hypothetical protein [Cochlodiniinecator piscidefendens]|uniref:hypothetical protein n=1 Tax=Cochlodiniinecator piscidefendens TaxID=2715756 RepID=UPI0014092D1A|nr:hypothetical protein [Cochlodiniinecator piscidefendens]
MTNTLERVTFRTLPNTNEADLMAAVETSGNWIKAQPGFHYRTLIKTDDGWEDLAFWSDEAAAKAASETFMDAPENVDYIKLIDLNTVVMTYLPQKVSMAGT